MMSDRIYIVGIQKSIKLQSKITPNHVYTYYYQYPSIYGLESILTRREIELGVSHGDDIFLLFQTPIRDERHSYTQDEKKMQLKLVRLYESFLANV